MYSRYWTGSDLLYPLATLNAWIAAGVARIPRIARAGLPGRKCRIANTTIVTMISTATDCDTRRTRNLVIRAGNLLGLHVPDRRVDVRRRVLRRHPAELRGYRRDLIRGVGEPEIGNLIGERKLVRVEGRLRGRPVGGEHLLDQRLHLVIAVVARVGGPAAAEQAVPVREVDRHVRVDRRAEQAQRRRAGRAAAGRLADALIGLRQHGVGRSLCQLQLHPGRAEGALHRLDLVLQLGNPADVEERDRELAAAGDARAAVVAPGASPGAGGSAALRHGPAVRGEQRVRRGRAEWVRVLGRGRDEEAARRERRY